MFVPNCISYNFYYLWSIKPMKRDDFLNIILNKLHNLFFIKYFSGLINKNLVITCKTIEIKF